MKEGSILAPLWMLTTGAAISAAAASLCDEPGHALLRCTLLGLGLVACVLATFRGGSRPATLFLIAGLALGAGRGLQARTETIRIEPHLQPTARVSLRTQLTITEGWSPTRWGFRNKVRVESAALRGAELPLPSPCAVEVRGGPDPSLLPPPGTTVQVLAELRGTAHRPLLVVASPHLIEPIKHPSGLAHLRHRVTDALFRAAGHDIQRIRAAELAAVLAVGRKDLIPNDRRQGWRRSGLAHALAVSGLHVGLVGGAVWLASLAIGLRPAMARLAVLLALPAYAVLAGASSSAVRAATMGMIYLAARLLGRSLVPIAAVLLAALTMILVDPTLVGEVGFQLTVLVTAALVRWLPAVTRMVPAPRWLAASIAVPLIAQLAALPIITWHFRTIVAGGVLTNLVVLPLLAPVLLTAIASAAVAPVSVAAGGALLELLHLGQSALWWCGALGRSTEQITPPISGVLTGALVISGWLALRPSRVARLGAGMWLVTIMATASWWALRPEPQANRVTLLPVADGSAVVVSLTDGDSIMFDAGRYRGEAADLLQELGIRRLSVVMVSHTDEDHMGGLIRVLETVPVQELVFPSWMVRSEAMLPVLRAARRHGTTTRRAARGSYISVGSTSIEVLWPPALDPPRQENDRSIVARLLSPHGRLLLTADTGRAVERHLATLSTLRSEMLLVPHHGSGTSTSKTLLDGCSPRLALVPAGVRNPHGHPKEEVMARLRQRAIPYRAPVHDGWCGAVLVNGVWRPFP